ncbi:MAG: signal recognition particle-docking protein FtsY [Erysipelotrichaceae bacterium]|nr:signal recognition particle-docking protein FtsY [Erysipelotrichaceae bacterium]
MGFFTKLKEKIFNKNKTEKQKEVQNKYISGLDKSRKNFVDKLAELKSRYNKVDEEYFEELEQILILSDVGVQTALNIVEATRQEVKLKNISDPGLINEILVDKMFIAYANNDVVDTELNLSDDLSIVMVVGVNGVGKTTSIAKLCHRYKNKGMKVLLAAGDTFRAGAVSQLQIWANRVGVDIVVGKENSDPSSVIYDAVNKAKNEHYDLLICDTAGRVQTKQNLMDELAKMNRIITKVSGHAANDVLLIIDATTGQNGVLQAKAFFDAVHVSGIVLTKMDSTSKGGIILAIKDELNIPVKFVCFGEQLDDIEEFDLDNYLYGLTKGMEENQ